MIQIMLCLLLSKSSAILFHNELKQSMHFGFIVKLRRDDVGEFLLSDNQKFMVAQINNSVSIIDHFFEDEELSYHH